MFSYFNKPNIKFENLEHPYVHIFGTRHRWTGRFEAHLWDKTSWNDKQRKKGRQGALLD